MSTTDNHAIAENGDLRNKKNPGEGRAKRRTFEAGFKLRVLEEWDRADAPERSAILRREGIYSSVISDWKRQKREGRLVEDQGARTPSGRGGPSYAEVDRLRRENEKLQAELAKAKFVIEVQGKVTALLEQLTKSADSDPNET